MKYKTKFTVVYSRKTGKIIHEIWEPLRRWFWPLPWIYFPGYPTFDSYEELMNWFEKKYPGKNITYDHYGHERPEP